MWQHLFHFVVRPIEAVVGLFLVLSAILLYPNEEGQIQSKFEDFWIRVDDYQKLALSKHASFMTSVANLESGLLDRLFGQRLVSVQLLCVSLFLSAGVPGLLAFIWGVKFDHADRFSFGSRFLGVSISSFVVALAAVLLQKNKTWRRSAYVAAALFLGFWAKYTYPNYPHHLHHHVPSLVDSLLSTIAAEMVMVVVVLLPMSAGVAFDTAFIIATRVLLRWAGKMTSSAKVSAIIVANCLLAVLLESPLLIFARVYMQGKLPSVNSAWGNFLVFIGIFTSLGNVFDVCFALLFVFLAVMLLLHRCVWPLLNRSLFRVTYIGTNGRRAILLTTGVALLGASLFGGKFPDLLQKLIERFAA